MLTVKHRASKVPLYKEKILKKIVEMAKKYKMDWTVIKNDMKTYEPQLAELLIKQGTFLVESNWMLSNRLKKMNEKNKSALMVMKAHLKNKDVIQGLH